MRLGRQFQGTVLLPHPELHQDFPQTSHQLPQAPRKQMRLLQQGSFQRHPHLHKLMSRQR